MEINLGELAGQAVALRVKSIFDTILSGVLNKTDTIYKKIFADFSPYMSECYNRSRYVRILCRGDDDVDLLSFYVSSNFKNNDVVFSDQEVAWEIGDGNNIIITGNGGAGKTFFMRKLWLDMFNEGSRTPLLVELRKLNDEKSFDIKQYLRDSISKSLDVKFFESLCSDGKFNFILDGFDELPRERHEDLQKQILDLASEYPDCGIVVSGRPDSRFQGWAGFKLFDAEPFSLQQTRELCEKVPFDEVVRKEFAKTLTDEFYARYRSFLSNPLLTIMMMMTFRRTMDIPRRMGIFYDEAFCALYQWHDATKAFKRKKNLDIQQFRSAFGTFCLLTLSKQKFDFSRTEIDEFITLSGRLLDLNLESELVLDDFERNVSLMRQDGLRYYFVHRSFQEYFAAWALVNVFSNKFSVFSEKMAQRTTD